MFRKFIPLISAAFLLTACSSNVQEAASDDSADSKTETIPEINAPSETGEGPIAEKELELDFKPNVREASDNEREFVLVTSEKIDDAIAELRQDLKFLPEGTPCFAILEEKNGFPLVPAFAVEAAPDWLGYIPFPECQYILVGGINALKSEDDGINYEIDIKIVRRSNNLDVEHVVNFVNVPHGEEFIFPISAMQAETMMNGNIVRMYKYAVFFSAGEAK